MFLFSKLIVLSSFALGTSALSIYLIPLVLKLSNKEINSLFQESESFYSSKKSDKFDESEKEILKKLNNLFGIFDKAVKYSNKTKNEKSQEINEFLDSTSKKESLLVKFYERNLEILSQLTQLFDELSKLQKEEILLRVKIGAADYSKSLVEKLEEQLISPWKKHIDEFICILEGRDYQKDNESCQLNSNSQPYSEGGALTLPRAQAVNKQKKH